MTTTLTSVGSINDFPAHLGQCVKVKDRQIAVFYLPDTEQQWFAIDNLNPQSQRMVLSRGITGDHNGVPYVACPLHKDQYSLIEGTCLSNESHSVTCYPVVVDGESVAIELLQ